MKPMYNYEYIRERRIAKGKSTVTTASDLEMDCGNYCKLEQGKYRNIPTKVLHKLCEVLELDLYHLLNITQGTTASI